MLSAVVLMVSIRNNIYSHSVTDYDCSKWYCQSDHGTPESVFESVLTFKQDLDGFNGGNITDIAVVTGIGARSSSKGDESAALIGHSDH